MKGRTDMRKPGEVLAKISRNGHAFWVRDVRQLEPNVFVGHVDNEIGDDRFPLGSVVAFVDAEVVDVKKPTIVAIIEGGQKVTK